LTNSADFFFFEKHTSLAYNVLALCYFALVHALIDFRCIHDFRFTPIGEVLILVRWQKGLFFLFFSLNRSRRVNTLLLERSGNKCVWLL